jgi:hypothetical protein
MPRLEESLSCAVILRYAPEGACPGSEAWIHQSVIRNFYSNPFCVYLREGRQPTGTLKAILLIVL